MTTYLFIDSELMDLSTASKETFVLLYFEDQVRKHLFTYIKLHDINRPEEIKDLEVSFGTQTKQV